MDETARREIAARKGGLAGADDRPRLRVATVALVRSFSKFNAACDSWLLLRLGFGYRGRIARNRDVLQDSSSARVGFDAFAVRPDRTFGRR